MPPRAEEAAGFVVKPTDDVGRGPLEMDSGEKRLVELGYKQVGYTVYPFTPLILPPPRLSRRHHINPAVNANLL